MKQAQNTLNETNIIDQSTKVSDTSIQTQISGDTTYDKSFRGINMKGNENIGYQDSEGETKRDRNTQTSKNGYIRKDNGITIEKPDIVI